MNAMTEMNVANAVNELKEIKVKPNINKILTVIEDGQYELCTQSVI